MKRLLILALLMIPINSGFAGNDTTFVANQNNSIRISAFQNLAGNSMDSFKGYNALLHLTGAGLTWLLVNQDVDYKVHNYFHERPTVGYFFTPMFLTGSLGPLGLSGYLYFSGKSRNNDERMNAGMAVLQAAGISVAYNTVLKFLTGRPNPDYENNTDMKALSKRFKFGLGKGGIFWGWPSGHTGVTMATVSALTAYYPDKLWLKIGGYSYVAYTLIGVSAVEEGAMHWFSDAVAAAFMNYAIGHTVGTYYRKWVAQTAPSNTMQLQIMPVMKPAMAGFNMNLLF